MSQQNLALVRGIYETFNAGDIGGALSRMSADIVWNDAENFPYADLNPYIGRQAILEGIVHRLVRDWDGFAAAMEELHDAGETIIATGRYVGTNKATGKVIAAQFVHVWRVSAGKATAFQQYADTLQVARAMTAD